MNYICYRYLYQAKDTEPRFLFGFVAPYSNDFMDDSIHSVVLNDRISMEYVYITNDQYHEFSSKQICNFSIFGFESIPSLEIKNTTTAFFSQQRYTNPVFTSATYISHWLEDYRD